MYPAKIASGAHLSSRLPFPWFLGLCTEKVKAGAVAVRRLLCLALPVSPQFSINRNFSPPTPVHLPPLS